MADSQNHIPKLEDFLGDSSSSSSIPEEKTQKPKDSSLLTQIYDPRHHNQTGFFSDFNTITGFQTGSEVDDSHLAGEYLGHVAESASPELELNGVCCNNRGALSLEEVNTNHITNHHYNEKTISVKDKTNIVAIESLDCSKKVSDNFGQRTSIYRGVTRHRWTGRYEAHLWDNSCRREGQARKGRQVYLGGYDKEDKAARAYDLAALKYWNATATTNFPITNYANEIEEMKHMTKQEFIASLRRKSSGFSRGALIYRGVTKHHQQGRWQARIGRVAGNKDLYLGTFATEEEAAEAYDIAAIKFRGINAVTNFEMNRYDFEAIMKSSLPIGTAAKRLKLSLETASSEQKPCLGYHHQLHHFQQQQLHQHESSPNQSSINFTGVCPNSTAESQIIPCGIPIDAASLYHHHQQQSFFQHFPVNTASDSTDSNNDNLNVEGPMGVMVPNHAEFFLWPNQSY